MDVSTSGLGIKKRCTGLLAEVGFKWFPGVGADPFGSCEVWICTTRAIWERNKETSIMEHWEGKDLASIKLVSIVWWYSVESWERGVTELGKELGEVLRMAEPTGLGRWNRSA